MKKRIIAITLMLAILLSGCSFDLPFLSFADDWEPVKFSDMVYEHVDIEEIKACAERAKECLDSNDSAAAIEELKSFDEQVRHFYAMYPLAQIHSDLDITDEYFYNELSYYNVTESTLRSLTSNMAAAVDASECADKINGEEFWENFVYAFVNDVEYTDALVQLLEKEGSLLNNYYALLSTLYDALDTYYIDGDIAPYNECNLEIAEIYIDLINVRNEQARMLGYDNYVELQYDSQGNPYTVDEAVEYMADVRECVVPLIKEMGINEKDYSVYMYPVSSEELDSCIGDMAEKMGGSVKTAFDYMVEYELYDTSISPNKRQQSYTISIPIYYEPFLFLDAWGDIDDIDAFAHEFGHFTDYAMGAAVRSVEVSEIFSTAMQFFVLDSIGTVLSELECKGYREYIMEYMMLYSTITQVAYADFEIQLYLMDADTLTVDAINELYYDTLLAYDCAAGEAEDYVSKWWMTISHYFESPMYILGYFLATDMALQVYEHEYNNPGEGAELYEKMLASEEYDIEAFAEDCGLESPFTEGRLEELADFLRELIYN